MKPYQKSQIINRVRYSTDESTLLCGNDWWDGCRYERGGSQKFLYRTLTGIYFYFCLTSWVNVFDRIKLCSKEEALDFFEFCGLHNTCRVSFEEAFLGGLSSI